MPGRAKAREPDPVLPCGGDAPLRHDQEPGHYGGDADLYLLALPLASDVPLITLLTFIGGFSAATAMVIVASVALSIMISNDIVMPVFLRQRLGTRGTLQESMAGTLLNIRRTAIFVVLLLGYGYYRSADMSSGLASLGLLSFAAISQMAPAASSGGRQTPAARLPEWSAASSSGPMYCSCRASADPTIPTWPRRS